MIKNKSLVFSQAGNSSRDSDKFIQLPRIANASLPSATAIDSQGENEGGIVYDTTNDAVYYSDGSSWSEVGGSGAGSNKALSNLASVAINTSLVSDADSTDDLGSSSIYWQYGYIDRVYVNDTAYIDGATAGKLDCTGDMDVSGSLTVDTNLTVTGTASIGTVQMDALAAATSGGDLSLDGDGSGGVDISSTSTGGITLGDDTTLASTKTLTITGTSAGTNYLTVTAGDIALTDGNIDMAEGKIEVDSSADESSYVKRDNSGAGNPVFEVEATNTGDTGSALLVDQNGTGNVTALEITHDGDNAAIDISAGAARTGDVIAIAMANQLAEKAVAISGAGTSANDEGMVDVRTTGALDGSLVYLNQGTGAPTANSHLIHAVSGGNLAGANEGAVARFEETGSAQATSYAVYISSTSNEALHVDAGESVFDEKVSVGNSGGTAGADFIAYGTTNNKFVMWDESADTFIVADDTIVEFGGEAGTADGVTMDWDDTGSSLDIDAVNANETVTFGSDTNTDVTLAGASANAEWDASADTLTIAQDAWLKVTSGTTAGDGLAIPNGTAAPTGTTTGALYFETDNNTLHAYNGTGWVSTTLS